MTPDRHLALGLSIELPPFRPVSVLTDLRIHRLVPEDGPLR